jgi:hypothetical protein
MTPRRTLIRLMGALVLSATVAACSDKSVEPELTDGELIRQVLVDGSDESILFATSVLADQSGTQAFGRTVTRVGRGFKAPRFYDDTVDDPGSLAFEATIQDTIFGELSFRVGATTVTRPYTALAFGGNAKLMKNASVFSTGSPWRIWRMQYRHAEHASGNGSPAITAMTVASASAQKPVATPVNVLIFRDSLLTLPRYSTSNVDVRVVSTRTNDTFFVTYPVIGGYETEAMARADSVTYTASVQVHSSRRYELLAVQGFKREAFTDTMYVEPTATAIRSAILAFR